MFLGNWLLTHFHNLMCGYCSLPEINFGLVEVDFHIFTVLHTELYKNRVPSVIPFSCCRLPNDKEEK